jgi:pilus assembly protein CpaB
MARRTIVLVVALLLAAIAAFAVWQFLQNVEDEAKEGLELVTVYQAVDFIGEGTEGDLILSQTRAEPVEILQRNAPANAIATEQDLTLVLSGRVAAGPISAGQVLTADQWVVVTTQVQPLAESIPEGKQAMTVSVDTERGVNGFVQPGDRVNVIVTLDIEIRGTETTTGGSDFVEGETGQTQEEDTSENVTLTRFVLQGLPVLAVGQEIRPNEEDEATVQVAVDDPTAVEGEDATLGLLTLEVTPEQAERLAYSFENGSTWLTLVPEDFVEVRTEGVTINNLFGDDLGILDELFER